MKYIPVWILISLTFYNCTVEEHVDFEGFINYEYSYESDSLNVDSLAKYRPAFSQFYFKDSLYFSSFIGQKTDSYIVNGKTGIAYYLPSNTDRVYCEDYKIRTDTIRTFKVMPTRESILGQDTKILEIVGTNGTNRYWVSNELKVNPENFSKHHAYNWYFYLKKADGGIILKTEHIFPLYTMKGIATEVAPMLVPDSIFKIPVNATLIPCE